jgi:thiamine kinase-like enzyme
MKFGLESLQKIKYAQACVPNWLSYSSDSFQCEPFLGGLTNLLTKVTLTTTNKEHATETAAVLVREFGAGTSTFMNRTQEEKVVEYVSSLGLCPKVYTSQEWGRIEEFVPSRTLTVSELKQMSEQVGFLMGRFHSQSNELTLRTTTSKVQKGNEEGELPNRLRTWLKFAGQTKFDCARNQLKANAIDLPSLKHEVDWVIDKLLPSAKSPIVFAHCDIQEGNILLLPDNQDLMLIDFEYSARMQRGFDIANCFREMTMCYATLNFPNFVLDPDMYPSQETQNEFLTNYCLGANLTLVPALKREAKLFALVSDLHWSIWAVIQSSRSTIEFGYLDYALQRMNQYWKSKEVITL